MDEKVADFNRAVRDGTLIELVDPNSNQPWCTGSFLFFIETTAYCASNSDLSLPCSPEFNLCFNLASCCTSGNKCGLGE